MKIFTEKGEFVGTVSDAEFEKSKSSVMPMRLQIKPAKAPRIILTSSGYRLFYYACLIGVISALLSAFARMFSYGNGFFAGLSYFGLLYDDKIHIYPLLSTLKLFALAVLVREHFLFLTALIVQAIGYIVTCVNFLNGYYPGYFICGTELISLLCTCIAFMLLSGKSNRKFFTYLTGLILIRFLLMFTEDRGTPLFIMMQLATAVCFFMEAVWFDYLGVRVRRKYKS